MSSAGGEDFRVNVAWFDHLKTRRLIRACGAAGALSLLRLWGYAAATYPSGHLPDHTPADIEEAARWTGEAGGFVGALVELGWLDPTSDGYELHEWAEWQPHVAGRPARIEQAREAGRASGRARRERAVQRRGNPGRTDCSTVRSTDYEQTVEQTVEPPPPTPPTPSKNPPTPLGGDAEGADGVDRQKRSNGKLDPEEAREVIEWWNTLADTNGLPSVRVPRAGTANARNLASLLHHADNLDHAKRAIQAAANRYASMRGGKSYALWNALRPRNVGQYLDADVDAGGGSWLDEE